MADKKISALTSATTPLAGTEVLPIVQSGATVKVAVSDLTAGRAISATAVTASTGNFVVGTSGQGVDFSATPGTGTSELLADYEEGTWTPGFDADGGSAGSLAFTSSGTYTKIGRQVTLRATMNITVAGSYTGRCFITNAPFAAATSTVSGNVWFQSVVLAAAFNVAPQIGSYSSTYVQFPYSTDAAGSDSLRWVTNVTTGLIILSITYFV
jgi:hypothetical protein